MKNLKKTSIAITTVIILTIICLYYFHQHYTTCYNSNVSEQFDIDTKNAQVLVPLEITPPSRMMFAEPFDRCMRPVPNLEVNNSYGEEKEKFFVPAGTINIALGKPVFSSDDTPILGNIGMINDGWKEYGKYGGYVELRPGLQNITIDLLQRCKIYAIVIWHSHRIGPVYFDIIVQVSNDLNFSKDVRTLFNNDSDNSSGMGIGQDKNYREKHKGKIIDVKGICSRYVRLFSNGNSGNELNHYFEVEVYGIPVE